MRAPLPVSSERAQGSGLHALAALWEGRRADDRAGTRTGDDDNGTTVAGFGEFSFVYVKCVFASVGRASRRREPLTSDCEGRDPRGVGELAGTATGYAFVVHGFACLVCCLEAC